MKKLTCPLCNTVFTEAEFEKALNEYYNCDDAVQHFWYSEEIYCPDCAIEQVEEWENDPTGGIPADEAADMYMSSGEDEDYSFGYDPDDLQSHYKG